MLFSEVGHGGDARYGAMTNESDDRSPLVSRANWGEAF